MQGIRWIAGTACVVLLAAGLAGVAHGESTITGKGKLNDEIAELVSSFALDKPQGYVLERNTLDLSFPEEGGSVSGTILVWGREDLSRFVKRPCIARRRYKGVLEGSFDGKRTLEGVGTATVSDTPVRGCGRSRFARRRVTQSTFRWYATFSGRELRGAVHLREFDTELGFSANLSDIPGRTEDAIGDGLRGRTMESARETVERIAGCRPSSRSDDACARAEDFVLKVEDALLRIGHGLPGESSLEANVGTITNVLYLAALRGREGTVLFPVARATLPILFRMVKKSVFAKDRESAARAALAARRFSELVIRAELDSR